MRLRFLIIVASVCVSLLLVALIALSGVPKSQIPASAHNPPVYPNAYQINVEEAAYGASKVVTFETSDAPEAVCTYYKATLAKDGWSDVQCHSGSKTITAFFEWVQTDVNGPTDIGYHLVLTAKAIEFGQTNVTLELTEFDPR